MSPCATRHDLAHPSSGNDGSPLQTCRPCRRTPFLRCSRRMMGAGLAELCVHVGTDLFKRCSQALCHFQFGGRQFHNIWEFTPECPHTLLRRLFFTIPRQHRQEACFIESFARRPNWLYKWCPADTEPGLLPSACTLHVFRCAGECCARRNGFCFGIIMAVVCFGLNAIVILFFHCVF